MKTVTQWKDIEQYHAKCVCQTCTCHKHRCPHCQIHLPLGEISSYEHDYHPHPLNPWMKAPPEKAKPYQPYGDVNSSYKASYPGHKPQLRQKLVPRVKNEEKKMPFDGQSEYKNKFPAKQVPHEPIKNKDKIYTPDTTPFEADTTYKTSYPKKMPNKQDRKKDPEYSYPDGYKFNGETTYANCYAEKPITKVQNFKPVEKLPPKATHDLNSIYRNDYKQKPIPEPCPILKMPVYPKTIHDPHQHLVYNKNNRKWEQK